MDGNSNKRVPYNHKDACCHIVSLAEDNRELIIRLHRWLHRTITTEEHRFRATKSTLRSILSEL